METYGHNTINTRYASRAGFSEVPSLKAFLCLAREERIF